MKDAESQSYATAVARSSLRRAAREAEESAFPLLTRCVIGIPEASCLINPVQTRHAVLCLVLLCGTVPIAVELGYSVPVQHLKRAQNLCV